MHDFSAPPSGFPVPTIGSVSHPVTAMDGLPRQDGLAVLADVLRVHGPEVLLDHGDASDALRGAVRLLCEEARAHDPHRAERLVIELKRSWPRMPEMEQVAGRGTRDAVWSRIVALCAEEFYARDARTAGPASRHTSAA